MRCKIPIENERKYVLRPDAPESVFLEFADRVEEIEQSYLVACKKNSARVRETVVGGVRGHTFTFKQDVGKKTVEIETLLSREDYSLLRRQSVSSFKKVRYRLGDWEVDFFKQAGCTYFVQAEIELPVGKKKPDAVHPLVLEHLILAVKRGDGRFSNKKLGDAKYAQKLLQSLEMKV